MPLFLNSFLAKLHDKYLYKKLGKIIANDLKSFLLVLDDRYLHNPDLLRVEFKNLIMQPCVFNPLNGAQLKIFSEEIFSIKKLVNDEFVVSPYVKSAVINFNDLLDMVSLKYCQEIIKLEEELRVNYGIEITSIDIAGGLEIIFNLRK